MCTSNRFVYTKDLLLVLYSLTTRSSLHEVVRYLSQLLGGLSRLRRSLMNGLSGGNDVMWSETLTVTKATTHSLVAGTW